MQKTPKNNYREKCKLWDLQIPAEPFQNHGVGMQCQRPLQTEWNCWGQYSGVWCWFWPRKLEATCPVLVDSCTMKYRCRTKRSLDLGDFGYHHRICPRTLWLQKMFEPMMCAKMYFICFYSSLCANKYFICFDLCCF